MPQAIAIEGVLIPALAAAVLVVIALVPGMLRARGGAAPATDARASRGTRIVRIIRIMAPATALAFLLAFRARQGFAWPPASSWEWIAPLAACIGFIAWLLPPTRSSARGRRARPIIVICALVLIATLSGWMLALPGARDAGPRLLIGLATLALTALSAWSQRSGSSIEGTAAESRVLRSSGLWVMAIAFAGLSLVTLGSGFEKLGTCAAAVAALLSIAGALALFSPRLRLGEGGAVAGAALLVAIGAAGRAHAPDSFPQWHWFAAPAALIAAMSAHAVPLTVRRADGIRAFVRLGAAALVALGNAAWVLAPQIARGEFPP